jgi:DNA-binding response OmpR family regulator
MSKANILIAEDDQNLSIVIRDYLTLDGYSIRISNNGTEAWNDFISGTYDLCILDIMMPEMDGFSLAEKIRKADTNIPILFLTAKTSQEDKIRGFRSGADDYIVKPFSIIELVLRIEVFLKRKVTLVNNAQIFTMGLFTFDFPNLSLYSDEGIRKLTIREAELLKLMIINKNQIVKRDDILFTIWGNDDYFLGRSLDVFISKLRKYLKRDPHIRIVNYHSVGFKLELNTF